MRDFQFLKDHIPQIQETLNYEFKDPALLMLAFVHRSFVNESKGEVSEHNERLEFLGDSILNLVIAEFLYRRFPDHPEGLLSDLRSYLVEASACVEYVKKLQLENYLLLGKGELENQGKGRSSILADFFEALVGALFLDGGFECVKIFIFTSFEEEIIEKLKDPGRNFKAELQDYSQKNYQQAPDYKLDKEEGPDHSKKFFVSVWVGDKELGQGSGFTKKEAQQEAAEEALKQLGE